MHMHIPLKFLSLFFFFLKEQNNKPRKITESLHVIGFNDNFLDLLGMDRPRDMF